MKEEANSWNIFYADDDHDDCNFFEQLVKKINPVATVHLASNGEEMMSKLAESFSVPDLIVLDLNMPFMNGFECLRKIKNDRQYSAVPVIIFSTSNNEDDIAKALQQKADKYMVKPSNVGELFKTVRQMIDMIAIKRL